MCCRGGQITDARRAAARLFALSLLALAAVTAIAAAPAQAKPFTFQPIRIQHIDLPKQIKSAGWPVFTNDGRHLLFFSTGIDTAGGSTGPGVEAELWITKLNGDDPHCLSCGVPGNVTAQGEGEVTPFPDGKRIFFGSFFQPGSSRYGVLECSPSVIDCKQSEILPVDFSAAEPQTIPPGGAVTSPQLNTGGAYAAKLSQDGKSVGFSDIRSDSIETMVVGKLKRSGSKYVIGDPRVINPPAPTSAADPNLDHWSDSGALYEFKTFSNGGRDATYVQSGGPALLNPEVWSVNLKTGERTQLTRNPDYDEDNSISPNGELLALWSNRTMHMTDWYGGLPPVRDFINTPAAVMGLGLNSSNKRCHGPIWLLPGSGDRNARLAGQPIVNTPAPDVFITNNLTGWPQWSPNGRMLALNTTDQSPGPGYPAHAPFLLVAHLTQTKASAPAPTVSSQPGSWAVKPTDYHPASGYSGTRIFAGPGGGSVTVNYGGMPGIAAGTWSETYKNFSEDGATFVNGSVEIAGSAVEGTYSAHLRLTGARPGSTDVEFSSISGAEGSSTYMGNTVSGPSEEQAAKGACPGLRPDKPQLDVSAKRVGRGAYKVKVTASIDDVGLNAGTTDTRAVSHAKLRIGGKTRHTGPLGTAVVKARGKRKLRVSAGDTLKPASAILGGGKG